MTLSAFRLSYAVGWSGHREVVAALGPQLDGAVMPLPTALRAVEHQAVLDALVLLAGRPVEIARPDGRERPGGTLLHLGLPNGAPEPRKGVTQVFSVDLAVGARALDLPAELRLLRDAVLDVVGRSGLLPHSEGLQSDGARFTDTPATAVAFIDGVWQAWQKTPWADWSTLRTSGLAAAIASLLEEVEAPVAAWAIARACGVPNASGFLSHEAWILGESEGLRRALRHALVTNLGPPVYLRAPLTALGEDRQRATLLEALRPRLPRSLHGLLEALGAPTRALGRRPPPPPRLIREREVELAWLKALLTPGESVRTALLTGPEGMGKTSLGLTIAQDLGQLAQPAWLDFRRGGRAAWAPLADALGMERVDDSEPIPAWVHRVWDALRPTPTLLVADNVEAVNEDELPRWLPTGAGRLAVLVLSRRRERELERSNDAVVVSLGPLSTPAATEILRQEAGDIDLTVQQWDAVATAVGGSPLMLTLAGAMLRTSDSDNVLNAIRGASLDADGLLRELSRHVLKNRLEPGERVLARQLAVGPTAGLPEAVVDRLGGPEARRALERYGLATREGLRVQLGAQARALLVAQNPADSGTLVAIATALIDWEAAESKRADWEALRALTWAVTELTAAQPGAPDMTGVPLLGCCVALARQATRLSRAGAGGAPPGVDDAELAQAVELSLEGADAAIPWLEASGEIEQRARRATLQLALAGVIAEVGRWEQSLRHAKEATAILRRLATVRPREHLPALAEGLGRMGSSLTSLARPDAAVEVLGEAVTLYRQIAVARPGAHDGALAATLHDLGAARFALGQWDEALEATREAVQILRDLASRPGGDVRPGLAATLNSLSADLRRVGRVAEAQVVCSEALLMFRALVADGQRRFEPDVAMSLGNLGVLLGELGLRPDALAATREAVDRYRELAARQPAMYLPELAKVLSSLGGHLFDAGEPEAAIVASMEAVSFSRALAQRQPDLHLPLLAGSLVNAGNALRHVGRLEESIELQREAVALFQRLAVTRPEAFQPDLTASLNSLALGLSGLDMHDEALSLSDEAVALGRELARSLPDGFEPDLARYLGARGHIFAHAGRLGDAAPCFEEGLNVLKPHIARDPATHGDLANALRGALADLRPAEPLSPQSTGGHRDR